MEKTVCETVKKSVLGMSTGGRVCTLLEAPKNMAMPTVQQEASATKLPHDFCHPPLPLVGVRSERLRQFLLN